MVSVSSTDIPVRNASKWKLHSYPAFYMFLTALTSELIPIVSNELSVKD